MYIFRGPTKSKLASTRLPWVLAKFKELEVQDVGFRILEWLKKALFKPKTLMEKFTCIINARILLPKKMYTITCIELQDRLRTNLVDILQGKTYEKHFHISRTSFCVPHLADIFRARESRVNIERQHYANYTNMREELDD